METTTEMEVSIAIVVMDITTELAMGMDVRGIPDVGMDTETELETAQTNIIQTAFS